ncbi:MAG: NAD(P)-dependent oxidoreductase, partial [Actinomycetota bacterium]|nr:NAD(P)-dependent oxidoreductase [Actinomycetota bacterium]
RIGKLVADRARAFQMRIVAFDPFVSEDRAQQIGVELLSLEDLVAVSDFLTVHLPRTPETIGLINADLLATAKPSLRVINVARGGIVVEDDLAACISAGTIAGAALDVFDTEPCTDSPLFGLSEVVVTPHLGASTREAQDKAGDAIADMMLLALAGEFVPWAVNVDAAEADDNLRPYLGLAERLGRLFSSLAERSPSSITFEVAGDIAVHDTRILGLAVLKGFFGRTSEEQVSFVNAPKLADSAGVALVEVKRSVSDEYINMLTVSSDDHTISGVLTGRSAQQRVVDIDGHGVDVPPAEHMLLISNDDRPGVIGTVGTVLGDAQVNIADMDVGRVDGEDSAVMLIATGSAVSDEVLNVLRESPGITSVVALDG